MKLILNCRTLFLYVVLIMVLVPANSSSFIDNISATEELEAALRSNTFVDHFTIDRSDNAITLAKESETPWFSECSVVKINWAAMRSKQPTVYFRFKTDEKSSIYAKNKRLEATDNGSLWVWEGQVLNSDGGTVRLFFDGNSNEVNGEIQTYVHGAWEFISRKGKTVLCKLSPYAIYDNGAVTEEKKNTEY